MKIVDVKKLEGTEKDVKFTGGNSLRALVKSDNMGFGVCKTHIPKGGPYHWHYLNHLEACYCISGKGVLTNIETKERHEITPDIMYVLDKHDNHTFEALEDVILISIFNPPLTGTEFHDENGNYL
jgi:L-ectoine synthase